MKSENEKKDGPIKSVADFISAVMEMNKDGKKPTAYRGQSNKKWRFFPKIFRECGLDESEHSITRDVLISHSDEFYNDQSMFDKLVRMQHFGVPTRLLDVTTNPLVALWFATENEGDNVHGKVSLFFVPKERTKYFDSDAVSCISNMANLKHEEKIELFGLANSILSVRDFNNEKIVKKLCYFVGMEKPNFKEIINPKHILLPLYVKPKLNNKRIVAQSGAFFIFGDYAPNEERKENPIPGKTLVISSYFKDKIRNELDLLGVNEATLFPELERTAKIISRRYEVEL
ncbi:FRG domain-containing protein [Dickeya dadantii]|uniref:FRG domain-containing protein n=1 Tax=Dickeya dadantii TaxID=204038 RepID=UPI001495C6AB|nr:FRG domain-containing protein [Dickeya dadantii]NPE57548.1 FRG domain-containing protein [Dickeya dadantii]NPE65546.1 FRG domain-containing protein [Dickeya dadantii]